MRTFRWILWLAPCAAAAACAPARAPVALTIGAAAGAECPVTVEGRTFSSTEDPAFEAELRRLAATGRRARVDGGPNTPYRCIGGVIYRAQRAGFSRVGFATEPPPSGE